MSHDHHQSVDSVYYVVSRFINGRCATQRDVHEFGSSEVVLYNKHQEAFLKDRVMLHDR